MAQTIGYYQIQSFFSNKLVYVQDKSKENGAKIVQMRERKSAAHDWKIEHVADGDYKIINRNSGKALEVFEHSLETGANIAQWDFHGADNQLWKIVEVGSSGEVIPPDENSNAPLTDLMGFATLNGGTTGGEGENAQLPSRSTPEPICKTL